MGSAQPGHSIGFSSMFERVLNFLKRLSLCRRGPRPTMHPAIKLEAVLAAMMDAVVISDREGRFIDFNEPFAKLNKFKSKSECMVALADYPSIFKVSTLDGSTLSPEDWPIQRALRGETGENLELLVERSDSHERFVATFNFAPIRRDHGSIVGAVLTGRDSTEARAAEERLKNMSSRLHLALSSAHLGVWEWDIRRNRLTWDDRMFDLYGVDRAHFTTNVEAWVAPLHPDDRESATQLLQDALRGERDFDTQFRVVHPNGTVKYLKANGSVIRGGDGQPERMLGVNADITEQKLAQERLERAYAEVEAKVIERTAQLEAAKIAAEQANKTKDLFLATLSHELRSPLSAILSWTQLMERGVLPADKVQAGIRIIKESVWAQNQLIGDLLDLSRIATGKFHIDRQPTEVVEVLRAAVESIRPSAEQRGLTIDEEFPLHDLYISADPARLKQTFWNILSNAVKFTPTGGKITIRLICREESSGEMVIISFQDTGKGIKAEFLPHIFERFSQADPSSVRVHGGMGLGLSLVRSLVELQDGTVSAESPGEGQGATFLLSFPLLAKSGELALEVMPVVGPQDSLQRYDLHHLKILLVEDGDRTRMALAQLLAAQGANVRAAASAQEALAEFEAFCPDIIVSDIAMPQEDGHSFMRKIRAVSPEKGGNTPAIALTAYAEPRDRERAFSSGFQEYLHKPVDAGVLANTILKLSQNALAAKSRALDTVPPRHLQSDEYPLH
jgi:PAS domain S-box-containing protein